MFLSKLLKEKVTKDINTNSFTTYSFNTSKLTLGFIISHGHQRNKIL